MDVRIVRLDPSLPLPSYAYAGDAGLDLYSAETLTIRPGERAIVGTGVAVAIPDGYAGFVQPRSGLAARHGLTFVNTPGLIDAHYRGEIKVIALNTDAHTDIQIRHGDRIAQLVIQPVPQVHLVEVAELDETDRASKGFGSSGTSGVATQAR